MLIFPYELGESPPAPFTVANRRNVLLGRDVMNQLLITLDGHQLALTIHDA
jgi:hypothetical protein